MIDRAITLRVLGKPAPQGSKSFKGISKNGKPMMVESSKAGVDLWRGDVVAVAARIVANLELRRLAEPEPQWPQAYPVTEPVAVTMVFTAARPKAHFRTGRNAHLLSERAPARPSAKPDLSKLLRSTEDALVTAGLLKDDALIVEYDRAAKVYVSEDVDALAVPGALIRIRPALKGYHPVLPEPLNLRGM